MTQGTLLPCLPEARAAGARPLIRYVGGKRWLVPLVAHPLHVHLVRRRGRLYEPFFGGGAVALHVGWPATSAGDANGLLVGCYREVARQPDAVADHLEALVRATPADDLDQRVVRKGREVPAPAYYAARDRLNTGAVGAERAALLLYLFARGFNGLMRLNARGEFNVPVGDVRSPSYRTREELRAFATVTESWTWRHSDFEATIGAAGAGDVVFADPPYAATFGSYTEGGFGTPEQVRLAGALAAARDRGALVVHTNSAHAETVALYRARGFHVLPTAELRTVNSDPTDRKARAACVLATSEPTYDVLDVSAFAEEPA